jgi:hypothetical protein
VSVRRAYRPREIEALAQQAGVRARVRKRSLFRWSLETEPQSPERKAIPA